MVNKAITVRLQAAAFYLGIVLIALACLLFIANVTGAVEMPEKYFAGEAAVHSIARVAVVGCLLAALGSLQPNRVEPKPKRKVQ